MDRLDISKVLKATTHIFAIIRFKPEEIIARKLLTAIAGFYQKELSCWRYEDFLKKLSNTFQIGQDELIKEFDYDNRRLKPTDNTDRIESYLAPILLVINDCSKLFDEERFEQLYDLVDAVHGLPEALLYKNVWNEKRFWKIYINPYRKKWDKKYLKLEQKQLCK